MKKKILNLFVLVVIVVAAAWNFNQSKSEKTLLDLTLANIDALAQVSEGGDGGIIVTCGRYEGYCWGIDWISPIGAVHCYFSGSPMDLCYDNF